MAHVLDISVLFTMETNFLSMKGFDGKLDIKNGFQVAAFQNFFYIPSNKYPRYKKYK